MAVGGGRATARLQIGHDGGQQGGQTSRAADRMTTGRAGRSRGAAAGRCSATSGGTTELGAEKKARRWVRAVGRGRVVTRQGDHQTGQTPVEGNDRAASALEGGGVAGTRRRNRVVTRGLQEPSGGTTAGTQRRRRDHARRKCGAR